MDIDKIKECWKEEGGRLSEGIHINRDVSFQKLRSSYNRIKVWRFVRIAQWFVAIPVFFAWGIFPNLKNDGSGLFYAALALLVILVLSFCASYIYLYIYLSKIDPAGPVSEVREKILRSERVDKRIYLFRFVSLLAAFGCAYKLFGSPHLGPERMTTLVLIIFILLYALVVRLKFQVPREYGKVKSRLEEMENEEKED